MKQITSTFLLVTIFTAIACNAIHNEKAIIGISPCGGSDSYTVSANYAKSVFKAGGVPVILPMVHSQEQADDLLAGLDGLILTGGEDVNPAFYGEDFLNETVSVNEFRDTSDFHLFHAARKLRKPILGTCRGEQIVNVFMGGSLYQDIPTQVGEALKHRQNSHWAYVDRDSKLFELLGKDSIWVNSFHHQAVKSPAPGFKVSAKASDGVVEAYESEGLFCIQFHPEAMIASGDDTFLPIYKDFVRTAIQNRQVR